MVKDYSFVSRNRQTYRHMTHRPLYALAMVGPLLAFYHAFAARYPTGLLAPAYMRGVLEFFGVTGQYVACAAVLTVLFLQHLAHRDPWKIHGRVVAGITAESFAWTVPLWVIGQVTGRLDLRGAASAGTEPEAFQKVLMAIGAGIYEEFIFRLALISVLMLIMVDILGLRKDTCAVISALLAAVLFSLCHFPGDQVWGPDPLPWGRFVFLALAGILWGAIFVFRGFAVAVGSHIVWDLYVFFWRA